MVHVSHAHKVIGVAAEPRLKNIFPEAKVVPFRDQPTLLLPHGTHETVLLRKLGFDVPAPILTQYQWTGNKKPFRVQQQTAALFTTNTRAYCLNGMGTGKTRAALWSYDYLRSNGLARKMLVIAPLSTLDRVWRREAFLTTPHLSVGVLHHTNRERRIKVLEEDHDIYVINTDGIRVLAAELRAKTEIDTLVIDELALFRNGGSTRNAVLRGISTRMVWVWGLTGSPTPTEPTDAWGQCRIVTPHTVPKYFSHFREDVMVKVTPFLWKPKYDAMDKVFKAMQPAVRYTLDDVVELPEVIERTIEVSMGPQQHHTYEELRKYAYAAIKNHQITAVNAGTVLNKLLQVSTGYVYSSDGRTVRLDNQSRLDALVDELNSSDRKVLVFVPYTHTLHGVHEYLTSKGIDAAMVHGKTSKKERDRIFQLFQDTNKFKTIVAHPGCMSHGLTLTAANTIIWFGPTTSLETFEQANARIRRVGQAHKQQVLMFQSTAAEKKMYLRLRQKQEIQENILELFEDATETSE